MGDAIDKAGLGQLIREELKKRGWSHDDFARQIARVSGGPKPSLPTISKWVKGHAYPSKYIQTINVVLGKAPSELVAEAMLAPTVDSATKATIDELRKVRPDLSQEKLDEIASILRKPPAARDAVTAALQESSGDSGIRQARRRQGPPAKKQAQRD